MESPFLAKRRKSALRYGLGIILWPVKIMLVFAIGLFVRLAIGPVDVPVPESAVDALMANAAPGWRMETSGAEFDLFGKEGLTGLKLRDVRIMDAAGNEKATVPRLGLSMMLSATDDINEAVAVHGVRIGGATIDVTRRADGTFSLGVGGLPDLPTMQGGEGESDDDMLAGLPKLSIDDARVNYRDEARGIDLTARSGMMTLDPQGRAVFDATVVMADGEPITLAVDATRSPDGSVALSVTFDDLDPASLAALDPALEPLSDLQMVLGGTVLANVAPDTTLETLTAELNAPAGGSVTIDGRAHRVERLAGTVTYAGGLVAADVTEFTIKDAGLTVGGHATIRQESDTDWAMALATPALAYVDATNGNRVVTGPVSVDGRFAGGVVRFDTVRVDNPVVTFAEGRVALGRLQTMGSFRPENGVLMLDAVDGRMLDASLPDLPIRATRIAGEVRVDTALDKVTLSRVIFDGISTEIEDMPVTLGRVELDARVDGKANAVSVKRMAVQNLGAVLPDGNAVTVAGMQVQGNASGLAEGMPLRAMVDRLDASGVSLTLPQFYDAPLPVGMLSLSSSIVETAGGHSIAVPWLDMVVDGLPARLQAGIMLSAEGARATLSTTVEATNFARIPALWPKGVAPGGYAWVSKNVMRGHVSGIAAEATIDTVDPVNDALLLKFDFEGGLVTAVPDLPPIQNGRGRAQVTLDRLDVFLDSGNVAVPATPGFTLSDSRFSILDFKPKIPDGHIKLNVDGPVESVLRFLDHEPLRLISKSGFDISTASGITSGKVQVKLPLAADLLIDDVDFRANADVREFSLYEPHTGVPITGDTMAIAVAPDGLKFRSDARIDGLAARLNYSQGFSKPEPGEPEGELTVQSYLTREDFALRAGVDVSDYFDGVAVLDAKVDLFPGGGARFAADADLTGAVLRLDRLGWVKADGEPVTVMLKGFRNPDGAGQVEQIDVRGTDIAATGQLSFDAQSRVRLVEFDRIALAETLDTAIRYSDGIGEAGKRIEISGDYLDLRVPFKAAMDATAADTVAPPAGQGEIFEIATNLQTVRLRDDLAVTNLRGGIRLQGERVNAAKVEGRVNGVGPALILAERRDDGLALRLTSSDAGAFLGAASVFEGATGGQLRLDARTVDSVLPSRIAGQVSIRGITVNDSETMREILSGGSIGSLARQMLSGGLTFTKVELPFTGVGGRWSIADGVVYGNTLGLTLDGSYDIDREVMDLTGTVSPAYAINGALGAVPVLGTLLTGGEGEGVFGVTFAVRGPTEDPDVWVNPLSALAPGFLRKIVSGVMDGQQTAQGQPRTFVPQSDGDR